MKRILNLYTAALVTTVVSANALAQTGWTTVDDYGEGVNSRTMARDITMDAQGTLYAIGHHQLNPSRYMVRTRPSGSSWQRDLTFPDLPSAGVPRIAADLSGKSQNVYAVATVKDTTGASQWMLFRKRPGTSWEQLPQTTKGGEAGSILVDSSGSVLMSGKVGTSPVIRVLPFDSSSATDLALPTFNGQPITVSLEGTAGLALAGPTLYVASYATGSDGKLWWLVWRMDGTAWSLCDQFRLNSQLDSYATSIASDPAGTIYVCGVGYQNTPPLKGKKPLPPKGWWLLRKSTNRGLSWTTEDSYVPTDYQTMPKKVELNFKAGSGTVVVLGVAAELFGSGGYRNHWIVRQGQPGSPWTTIDDFQFVTDQASWACSSVVDKSGNLCVAGIGWVDQWYNISHWLVRMLPP